MEDEELRRLRWKCRRGMQELDILLSRFLDELGKQPPAVQAAFERLLGCEDDRLWEWLSGRSEPDDEDLRDVVHRVRQDPAH